MERWSVTESLEDLAEEGKQKRSICKAQALLCLIVLLLRRPLVLLDLIAPLVPLGTELNLASLQKHLLEQAADRS